MKLGKTPGGSGIRVEHLRDWMEGAKPDEFQKQACLEAWNRVLELVELAFTGQPLPRSFGIGILVLIPKGVPDQYRGIALLEVIYKLISAIINQRLAAKITFHDTVHGFCQGRGTGTAIIEAKLRMQLAQRTTKPRYFVFLDLKKAYDTLDRGRTLAILKGYGIGRNILSIIKRIWDMDTMVPKQAGFYGESFSAGRGVRQGDILLPMIFNIVADAVIRDSEAQISESRDSQRQVVDALFYADDGALMGEDAMEVQSSLDIYTKTFARVGLKMNAEKTKAFVMDGGKIINPISLHAYRRRVLGVGETHRELCSQKVVCELCGTTVTREHLKTHQLTTKCNTRRKDYRATPSDSVVSRSNDTSTEPLNDSPSEYSVSMGWTNCNALPCGRMSTLPNQCYQNALTLSKHSQQGHHHYRGRRTATALRELWPISKGCWSKTPADQGMHTLDKNVAGTECRRGEQENCKGNSFYCEWKTNRNSERVQIPWPNYQEQ